MSDLLWRKLKTIKVPEFSKTNQAPGAVWSIGLDSVTPKRLHRLSAKAGAKWKLKDRPDDCSADGYPRDIVRPTSSLIPDAPLGCLVGKIGGSTADNTGTLFAVGRYCVFQIDETKTGPLFLGVNDVPEFMGEVDGQMDVDLEVAL
jgi:hypothetical protein